MKEKLLFVKAKKKLHKVRIDDISYIEAMDDYIKIQLRTSGELVTRMTMKGMLSQLHPKEFIRVHRSFIVPVQKIEAVGTRNIVVGGQEIALGRNYSRAVLKLFRQANG